MSDRWCRSASPITEQSFVDDVQPEKKRERVSELRHQRR